jgi:hypothetical protein
MQTRESVAVRRHPRAFWQGKGKAPNNAGFLANLLAKPRWRR